MKALKISVILFAAGFVAFVIATNVVLAVHLVPQLASEGEGLSFNLNYSFAWSIVPTYVTVHDVQLDGTDHNVHWQVVLRKVKFRYKLWDLWERRFVAEELSGEGVTVDVRHHSEDMRAEIIAKLKAAESPEPSDPWKITIQNIDLQNVHTVRLDNLFYQGQSEVGGEFTLRPGIYLEIPQSSWVVHDGVLQTERSPILKEVRSASAVRIHPTQLAPVEGNEIFATMDIHHSLRAVVLDSRFLNSIFGTYRSMDYDPADGYLVASIDARFGRILLDSFIRADLGRIHLKLARASVRGQGSIHWKVNGTPTGDRADLRFHLKKVAWISDSGRTLARPRYLLLKGTARDLSLVSPFDDLVMKLAIRSARISALNEVVGHFSGPRRELEARALQVDSAPGIFDFDGQIVPKKKSFHGSIRYDIPTFMLSHNRGVTEIQSPLVSRFDFRSRDYESGSFELQNAFLSFGPVRITHEGRSEYRTEDWNARFRLLDSRVELSDGFTLRGHLHIAMTDAKVPVRYLLPDRFWIPIGLFFAPMNNFEGEGYLEIDRALRLSGFEANSSSGRVTADLRSTREITEYALLLEVLPIDLCLTQLGGGEQNVDLNRAQEKCELASSWIRSRENVLAGEDL